MRHVPVPEKQAGQRWLNRACLQEVLAACEASPLSCGHVELSTHNAPWGEQGRRLMQSALVAGGVVPLATGAAAAGSLLATFLQGGINALNALSTSLTDVASAVSRLVHELIHPRSTFSLTYSTFLPSFLCYPLPRRSPARRLPLSRKSRLPRLQPCRRQLLRAPSSRRRSPAQPPATNRSLVP